MSELFDLQATFLETIAEFVLWATMEGWKLTSGEFWRSPEEAVVQAARGAGVVHSCHTQRLAADLNAVTPTGVFCTTKEDFEPLGIHWKTMHPLARWGGDFTRVDADHFSFTYQGVS